MLFSKNGYILELQGDDESVPPIGWALFSPPSLPCVPPVGAEGGIVPFLLGAGISTTRERRGKEFYNGKYKPRPHGVEWRNVPRGTIWRNVIALNNHFAPLGAQGGPPPINAPQLRKMVI